MNIAARCGDHELVSSSVSEVSLVSDSRMGREGRVQALTAWIAPGCMVRGEQKISFVNLEKVKRLPLTKTDHTQVSQTRSPG